MHLQPAVHTLDAGDRERFWVKEMKQLDPAFSRSGQKVIETNQMLAKLPKGAS